MLTIELNELNRESLLHDYRWAVKHDNRFNDLYYNEELVSADGASCMFFIREWTPAHQIRIAKGKARAAHDIVRFLTVQIDDAFVLEATDRLTDLGTGEEVGDDYEPLCCTECGDEFPDDMHESEIETRDPKDNPYCESCYYDIPDRHRALARHLGVSFEELTEARYREEVFELCSRKVKRGTSPKEARERADFVKDALAIIFPDIPREKWTTGHLLEQYTEARRIDLTGLKKEVTEKAEKVFDLLDLPRSEKVNFTNLDDFFYLLWVKLARKLFIPAPTAPSLKKVTWIMKRVIGKIEGDYILKPLMKTVTALNDLGVVVNKYEELRLQKASFHTYTNIVELFRSNPQTLEMTKRGIHDLVNSLYFVCPDSREGSDHAKDHSDTLREAFNGEEIKDRRKLEQADDGEYLILDDSEADKEWDERLQSYLDECVLPELDERSRTYFDEDRWKEDAKGDGRGHAISSYDGDEDSFNDEETENTWYVYRLN